MGVIVDPRLGEDGEDGPAHQHGSAGALEDAGQGVETLLDLLVGLALHALLNQRSQHVRHQPAQEQVGEQGEGDDEHDAQAVGEEPIANAIPIDVGHDNYLLWGLLPAHPPMGLGYLGDTPKPPAEGRSPSALPFFRRLHLL